MQHVEEEANMDTYGEAILRLERWNEDEMFYRGYYMAEKDGTLSEFLKANASASSELLKNVQEPISLGPNKTEEMFFSIGRNISIVKHPRYLPVFEHKHAFFEILYVLSGQCTQIFMDRTVKLRAGDYCLIAPGVTHAVSVFDDSIILNILIRRSTFLDIFLNTVRNKSQISLFFLGNLYEKNVTRYMIYRTNNDLRLRNYILDIYLEQSSPDEYSDRIMCSLLAIFFHQLTRRHGRAVETSDSTVRDHGYGEEMINYIIDHYATVSIKTLSEHFHFAEPYCSKMVKKISGSTFTELLTSIRMRKSENLLVYTQLSVEEISSQVGYKNPESFIRCFKRIYHVSPSQYRKDPERSLV